MILADKIIDLRKKNGWSQEELAEKLHVSRQAVSKWESAQSVPDMNRVLEMSDLFGVSTDYLLKDDLTEDPRAGETLPEDTGEQVRRVTMEEAQGYLRYREKAARNIALGVLMCILSPVPVVLLSGLQDAGFLPLSEDRAAALGLLPMFLLIGGAVALFILAGVAGRPFAYLYKESFETEYGVSGMVKERQTNAHGAYVSKLVSGIVLCVVSVIPIFVAMLLPAATPAEEDARYIVAAAVLLCMVAVGVWLILLAAISRGGYAVLLQEGEHSREAKAAQKKNSAFSGAYWSLVTAGYLAYSFITMRWDRSWIVWPVAAVLYGAALAVWSAARKNG